MNTISLDPITLEHPQPTHRRARIVVAAAGLAVIASVAGVAVATRDDGAGTRAPDAVVNAPEPADAGQDPLVTRYGNPGPADAGQDPLVTRYGNPNTGPTADRPFRGRW
jgi:hypothetical protein